MKALILAGGGARGAFQVGMLKNLVLERGLDFEIIRGVSVGAINAAWLAQAKPGFLGPYVHYLYELWLELLGSRDIYTKRFLGIGGLLLGADSVYSYKPLRKMLEFYLSVDLMKISGRDFKVGVLSLLTGEYKEFSPQDPDFIEMILASASIPAIFPPVDTGYDILVDGGVRNIAPISSTLNGIDIDADEIYILLANKIDISRIGNGEIGSAIPRYDHDDYYNGFLGIGRNGFDILMRSIEILTDEILLGDLREIMNSGRKINIIAPKIHYGERNDSLDFSPSLIRMAIEHGEDVAREKDRWVIYS